MRTKSKTIRKLFLIIVFISFPLYGMNCPKNPPDPEVAQPHVPLPYLLLNRTNWLDFDPGKIEESIAKKVSENDLVSVHNGSVIGWANEKNKVVSDKKVSEDNLVSVLKPSNTQIPVNLVEIQQELGVVKTDIFLDGSWSAEIGAPPFGNMSGGTSRFYAFKANMIRNDAKYKFSLTQLVQQTLSQGIKLDLRGLPRTFYAFEQLDNNSGRKFSTSGGGGGGFSIFTAKAEGKFNYHKNQVTSFRNKVFGVSFMQEDSYLDDNTWKDTGNPLNFFRIKFSEPEYSSLQPDAAEKLELWKNNFTEQYLVAEVIRDYELFDDSSNTSYKIKLWVKKSRNKNGRNIYIASLEGESKYSEKGNFIKIDGSNKVPLEANKGLLLNKYPGEKTPYNSDWFFYSPGNSVEIVLLDNKWRNRRSFVEFVQ